MAKDKTQCKRCGSTKWSFESGFFWCQRCGEADPAAEEVIFADHPRLTPDDYEDGGDAA